MSEANGRIWSGCRGHTSNFFERNHGIFNDHRESGPRFNVSSEGRTMSLYDQCKQMRKKMPMYSISRSACILF